MVRIPQIKSLETAIRLYYERIELRNADIKELFGGVCQGTVDKLKRIAKDKMKEDDVPSWNALAVNTEAAYGAWGLKIEDLENRLAKLQKLNLHKHAP